MPRPLSQLLVLVAPALLLAAVVGPEPSSLVVGTVTAIALAAIVGARYLAVLVVVHVIGVGDRARAHSSGVDRHPAPRHPNTRGRRRSRAPSPSAAVA